MYQSLSRITAVAMLVLATTAQGALMGPDGGSGANGEYSEFADSPFAAMDFSGGYFHFTDFEFYNGQANPWAAGEVDVPGVTVDNGGPVSYTFGPGIHDSVDLDDGAKDGSGLNGESWFYGAGPTGVTWTFNAGALGALPTHVGIVWTDGSGAITFEAFGPGMVSLGTLVGNHADGSFSGTTLDDRFYGVVDLGPIMAIKIKNAGGGIEIDHLQFGNMQVNGRVPEPGTLALLGAGLVGVALRRRRSR